MPKKNIDYLEQNAFSKLANQKKYQIVTGLDNFKGELRNTCFMNSVIQILLNMPELTLYFLSKQYDKDKKVSGGMADAYRDLLLNINDSKARHENLVKINRAFANVCKSYEIGSQHDATYFLLYFLNYVSKEVNDPKFNKDELKILKEKLEKESDLDKKIELQKQICESQENMFLFRLIFFQTLETRNCSHCNSCTFSSMQRYNHIRGNFGSLENLIKSIYKDSLMDEEKDKEFCKTCNKKVSVNYRGRIYGAPNYFVLRREKYGEHPKFSFVADDFSIGELAAKKEDQDVKYELTGVVCRSGGKDSGHCYSYCKKHDGWYCFSDDTFEKMPDDYKIEQDEDVQKNFFLGFYKKKDMLDKDLFEGYDINDFVHDEEDLKIISELSEKEEDKSEELPTDQIENNNNNNNDDDLTQKPEQTFTSTLDDNKNPEDDKNKSELDCDLENLFKISKTLDKLESNFIKVKDKKTVFDESVEHLNKVFDNNKSNRKIFKELLNTNGEIDQALDKIKKELAICIMCSNMTQNKKLVYIECVKGTDKIIWLRYIWQIIKNIFLFRFSEVNKLRQSIIFERVNELRIKISTKELR